jgi:amino acid adenylation domain-containing protein
MLEASVESVFVQNALRVECLASRHESAIDRDLPSKERNQVLIQCNDTSSKYPRNSCIQDLFAGQVVRTPDNIAVVCGSSRLTYRDLDRRSNKLAHHLRSVGVGPEVVVGLFANRSLEMVVGLLGILKAGGAYLPLDVNYPEARIASMIAGASASIVLSVVDPTALPANHRAEIVSFVGDSAAIARQSACAPTNHSGPDSLAYVMYTSGSTGIPKSVGVTHRNVVRLVTVTNYVDISPSDVFLQLAPLGFDAATFEIWGALLNGAQLVLYPDESLELTKLKDVIANNRISILWLTAGLFHRVVDEIPATLTPVKQLLVGGDVLSVPHVRKVLSLLNECQVINGYGPTECTTFSACFRVPGAAQLAATVPIGRPVSNTQIYILNAELQPVSVGTVGELYIGGDGLSRGYLNSPRITAERFIPNPFGAPGTRLYRTGDLGRYRKDGMVEFLGRVDRQLKVRGYRIEPGEIEEVLLSHPSVRQAVINTVADAAGDKRLIAYVVGDSGLLPETPELRSHIAAALPAYMRPSAFVALDALPLTQNGKVDYNALPPPEWRAPRHGRRGALRTPVEKVVAAIWSELLGHQELGVHDNFFELGGTVVAFSAGIARINDRFGISLDTSVDKSGATLAGVVNAIRGAVMIGNKGEN